MDRQTRQSLLHHGPLRWAAEFRVRHDRVDKAGKVTLRHNGQLHHIGIGRPHNGTPIVMLIHDLHIRHIRIIHAATGEIIRQLTLDPQTPLPRHRQTHRRTQPPLRTPKTKQPEP